MKITQIFPYKAMLPFTQNVAGKDISNKEGALVQIDGKYLVDLSPFPGFSTYLPKKVTASFFHQFPKLQKKSPWEVKNPHHAFALFQLECQKKKLITERFDQIPCHLFSSQAFCKKGRHKGLVKTKIKPENFLQIIRVIKKSPEAKFRLDGNAQFTLRQYLLLEKELWPLRHRIDFLEEPLKNFTDYKHVNLPYAHEEHLQSFLKNGSEASAVVIKPSQQGLFLLKNLKATRVILSSAFETPPALHALYVLAKKNTPEAHGLGAFLNFDDLIWN